MTPTITNSTCAYKIFSTVAEAESIAAQLRADDDSAVYEVRVDPKGSGRARIAIIDVKDGFLGYL